MSASLAKEVVNTTLLLQDDTANMGSTCAKSAAVRRVAYAGTFDVWNFQEKKCVWVVPLSSGRILAQGAPPLPKRSMFHNDEIAWV